MAVEPLFVSSMAELKGSLRLSGATQTDTLSILNRSVQQVRIGFYDRLGATRVSEIKSYAVADNPTSATELTRLKARNIEILWVKLLLVRELPILFMDASGQTSQVWNEEGLTRDVGPRDLNDLVEYLQEQVDLGLGELAGGEAPASKVNTYIGNPTYTPPRPGESVFGRPSRCRPIV